MFGPDVAASVTVEEFGRLAQMRDALAIMDAHPVDKDFYGGWPQADAPVVPAVAGAEAPLSAGMRLRAHMLTLKKPGSGIPEPEWERVVGRRLVRDVRQDRLLTWEDLDNRHDQEESLCRCLQSRQLRSGKVAAARP